MNITSRLHGRKPGGFLARVLSASLSVWLVGVAFTPALAATTVPVDQSPLSIQKSLPPNITLMLDDSGSMAWDYMPDWGYLTNTSNDGLRDSANNGIYYNPAITYMPPPKADGTSYLAQTDLTAAYVDGFATAPKAVDVTKYKGNYDYYTQFTIITTTTSTPTSTPTDTTTYSCEDSDYPYLSGSKCYEKSKLSGKHEDATAKTTTTYAFSCNGGDTLNASNKCEHTSSSFKYFFTYTTGPAAGSYAQHYVGGATGDCASLPAASKAVCDDTAVTQQNVANWFSYYHTRILMAKSGLMDAFATVDTTFRVGFGSIDGGDSGNDNYLNLPSSQFSYKDRYNRGNNYIAKVQPFGLGSDATSQKSAFWTWVAAASASGGTPLRQALDAVGSYYTTTQPWSTMSSDPDPTTNAGKELACRQSYTILTTDGFWNGYDLGNPNIDGTDGTAVAGPNGQSYTYKAAAPYKDSTSDTLADVAMKYWETDLRGGVTGTPNTPNEVPISTEDPAFWQHMTTFTLGLGFTPTGITPTGTTIKQIFDWANGGASLGSSFSWPTPKGNSINNIADLAHAALDGHGGFYSASSPQSFASGVKDALKRASERVGTGASLAANSTQLKSGAMAYQANYYTAKWKGDLKAYAVDANDGTLATTPTWTAASQLPVVGSRNIYTNNAATTPTTVAFTAANLTSLSAAEQSALGATASAQANMINYLRGDPALEQKNSPGTYRNRDTPLGDIVDSQPVYVGAPDANQYVGETFSGSDTFAAYASSSAAIATPVILVDANDGMAHAFDADTGVEKYAYLPAAVITSGLKTLADPDYGTTTAVPHQYFNDGELTVADVYNTTTKSWQTVAVGTTGRGIAKAIYALDVTNPAAITFLWERSAGDTKAGSKYIGQMTGKPVIAQTADGVWSVLMGNGYNSTNGVAALLQFAITDGTLSVHTTTDTTTGNGLAAPAVWLGDLTTGVSTIAYAGDLLGQVWSFDLNTGYKSTTATPTSTGVLLYTAKDASGDVQPITAGMLAGKNPATGDLWTFFGTGQYLSTTDFSSKATQSWYGLIVSSTTKVKGKNIAVDSSKDRTALVQRSIIAETSGTAQVLNADGTVKSAAIAPARAITALPSPTGMDGMSGWYIDLLSPSSTTTTDTPPVTSYTPNAIAEGERVITPNQFQGNQLLATTRIPEATDVCNPSGRGWIMAVDPFTGTSPKSSFFDLNGDGLINQPADYIMVGGKAVATSGIGFSSLPNNPIFMGGSMLVTFDNGTASSIKTSGSGGGPQRVSWRELINP